MTEPRIQYAKTEDGVSIAYCTQGQGTPLVEVPASEFSHLQLVWQTPARHWYEELAAKRMLVRYDGRGTGLSDRDVSDFSLEALLLDLEAVVNRVGLERFALFGLYSFAPLAIAYAAQHPQRVSHLLMWLANLGSFDPRWDALRELADTDWNLYLDALAGLFGGQPDEVAATAAWMRECVTPEAHRAIHDAVLEFDVASLLPKVTSPTLVLHRRQYQFLDLSVSRSLVAQIPDARLVLLEGSSPFAYVGDSFKATMDAIDEFLGEGEEPTLEPSEVGAFRTVLFTDVEGSTALTDRLGDAKARELLREHERMVREALKSHGGSEVKTLGDGFMASFSSATKALECAIAVQSAFAKHNAKAEEPIRVRVGLNAGEPIAEDDPDGRGDLFGTAVNMAARIAAKADAGEILVADVVRQLVAGKEFLFADRGETELRGFEDPVRVYEVRWDD